MNNPNTRTSQETLSKDEIFGSASGFLWRLHSAYGGLAPKRVDREGNRVTKTCVLTSPSKETTAEATDVKVCIVQLTYVSEGQLPEYGNVEVVDYGSKGYPVEHYAQAGVDDGPDGSHIRYDKFPVRQEDYGSPETNTQAAANNALALAQEAAQMVPAA